MIGIFLSQVTDLFAALRVVKYYKAVPQLYWPYFSYNQIDDYNDFPLFGIDHVSIR